LKQFGTLAEVCDEWHFFALKTTQEYIQVPIKVRAFPHIWELTVSETALADN
jgi:hypothetical protein